MLSIGDYYHIFYIIDLYIQHFERKPEVINKKYLLLLVLFCLALAAVGTVARSYMTDRLAVHWNVQGQADGYGSAFTAIYLFPLIILAAGVLVMALPNLDPLRANVLGFRDSLYKFILAFSLYMGYVYLLTLAWNLGLRFDMNRLLPPAFALLFWMAGSLMARAKRNFFIGIRTPWTLSNDLVWDRTHARGAVAFKACALVCLLGLLLPAYALVFLLVPLLIVTSYLVIYTYLEYRRVTRAA